MVENSAAPWNQKRASLSQEVVRRLLTTSKELPQETKDQIINEFTNKLRLSGYSIIQAREIVSSGVKGYLRKWESRAERHRKGSETENSRRKKKLLGKTTWFRNRKPTNQNQGRTTTQRKRQNNHTKEQATNQDDKQPAAVIFDDRTPGGELARRLRQAETELGKISKKRVKVVERNGAQLQLQLTKSDPWGDTLCERPDCTMCSSTENTTTQCRTSNVV